MTPPDARLSGLATSADIRYYPWRFYLGWGVACTVDCQGGKADTVLHQFDTEHEAFDRARKLNLDYRRWNNISHPSWTDPEPLREP